MVWVHVQNEKCAYERHNHHDQVLCVSLETTFNYILHTIECAEFHCSFRSTYSDAEKPYTSKGEDLQDVWMKMTINSHEMLSWRNACRQRRTPPEGGRRC